MALLAAEKHFAYQERVAQAATRAAELAWAKVTLADLDASWAAVAPALLALVTAAQTAAARDADPYLSAVLAEQGMRDGAEGAVNSAAFAGIASDGRPLDTLLAEPLIGVKTALKAFVPPQQALASQGFRLGTLAQTMVQDSGRLAVTAGIAIRPHVGGHVRMLTPPSCSRCVILAGRWYRWSTGFQRHPRCLPAGVVVSGPIPEATTRRWFQGELVVIRTASGKQLPITANHPVLTDHGWLPAHLLAEGDNVVGGLGGDHGTAPLVVPDEYQMPTVIENLWRPDGMLAVNGMPTAAEDFHGDGGNGKVDVIYADSFLRGRDASASGQLVVEDLLRRRVVAPSRLSAYGASLQGLTALARTPDSIMTGFGLRAPFLGGHSCGANQSGVGSAAWRDSGLQELGPNDGTANAVAIAEAVFALAFGVGVENIPPRGDDARSRWDAPAGPLTAETRRGYASRGQDLRERLAGKVTLDRIVDLERVKWSGHVYNLSSVEGWFNANGIIVSNCDCRMIPANEDAAGDLTTDSHAYFNSLSSEAQDRTFTKAGAEAVRLGADINQIVNARRGAWGVTPANARITKEEAQALRSGLERGRLKAASLHGRDAFVTTEGTTVRGIAGQRLGNATKQGGRYRRAQTARLMPETILQIANDRSDAIRLLQRFGYII